MMLKGNDRLNGCIDKCTCTLYNSLRRGLLSLWGVLAMALPATAVAMEGSEAVDRGGVRVSPADLRLLPDAEGRADVSLRIAVPATYLGKRARLLIEPRLVSGSGELLETYDPLVLDAPIFAKKMTRRERLEGYADPYAPFRRVMEGGAGDAAVELPLERTLRVPLGMSGEARLVAVVTTDGCAACTALDTLTLAAVMPPEPVDNFSLRWMEPVFVEKPKVMSGSGSAALRFAINSPLIEPERGDNRRELERMAADLTHVLSDTLAELRRLEVVGLASADGPLPFNATLAHNRAESARRFLVERFDLDERAQARITATSRPEGWEPVLEAMRAAGDAAAPLVADILERYEGDDAQELYIRRLAAWGRIKERYLQADRKVEYTYTYLLRSFTSDEELKRMYTVRPDAFNEDEFLRVAELAEGTRAKLEVYRTLLRFFPESEIGRNNFAVLEHRLLMEEKGGKR